MLCYKADMKWRALGAVFFFPAMLGILVAAHMRGHDHILTGWFLTLIGPIGWGLSILLAFLLPVLVVDTAFRLSSGTREAASVQPNGVQFNALRHPGFIAWDEIDGVSVSTLRIRGRCYDTLQIKLTRAAWRKRGMLPGSPHLGIRMALLEQDEVAVSLWLEDLVEQRRRHHLRPAPAAPRASRPVPAARSFGRKLV